MIQALSYSSISLYLTCAENWRRKYVERQATATSPALIFGSAFHDTVERYITHKHDPNLSTPLRVVDFWGERWQAKLEAEPDVEWGAESAEQHYNEGVRILGADEVQALVDSITPFQDDAGFFIERKIELRVPGVPVPVIGYIDIMTADGVPGDFKTSSKRWTQDKAQDELQTLFYLAALSQMGIDVPDLKFRHYVVTKTKSVGVQILEHRHHPAELFWLYDLIRRVWRGIEAEVYTFAPVGSWKCSPRFCEFYADCRGMRW